MRRERRGMVLAALLAACVAGSASAQSVIDQGRNLLGGQQGGAASGAGAAGTLPGGLSIDKIVDLVQKQGYSNISNIIPQGNNMLKATALNSSGSPVDLLINGSSGDVVSAVLR